MLKKISKYCLSVIAIVTALVLGVSLTSCAKQSDPITEFREAKSDVRFVESEYLTKVKELCEMSLDDEKEVFIKAYSMDGVNYIKAHVLTESNEYIVYSVDSQMSGPLSEALYSGEAPMGYVFKLKDYLQEVEPHADKSNNIIYFD